jgi:pyrimidine-specific ribonucleoside hydrolase
MLHPPRTLIFTLLALVACATPAFAHDIASCPAVVIDTDMGLDDVVTLAMALQSPHIDIVAIVVCEGVSSRKKGVEHLERLLDLFNRREIPLYAPADVGPTKDPPPFRPFAENAVARALPSDVEPLHQPFTPDAYVLPSKKTVILTLGPLTNLAAALTSNPGIKNGVATVVVAGTPKPEESWNLRYDPGAFDTVRKAGLAIKFIAQGTASHKPEAWADGNPAMGQRTSIGESFWIRLLEDPSVRRHYCQGFPQWHDELVFLYLLDESGFDPAGEAGVFTPKDREALINLFVHSICNGRQHKERVVFVEGLLPAGIFQADVRKRMDRIIAKNGEGEWLAQILTSELHEHLGAYSVIGVKMGLRAAELLNAPQHAMTVGSHCAAHPPVSCLNDGIIVATGCTPGRTLFTHIPGPRGSTQVTFSYNGRRITLALKSEYEERIRSEIQTLLKRNTLAEQAYWDGVRALGLDIWENWHRRDIFETLKESESGTQ